jgi:hypothetical protein
MHLSEDFVSGVGRDRGVEASVARTVFEYMPSGTGADGGLANLASARRAYGGLDEFGCGRQRGCAHTGRWSGASICS